MYIIFTDYNFYHLLVISLSILTIILRACRNSCALVENIIFCTEILEHNSTISSELYRKMG